MIKKYKWSLIIGSLVTLLPTLVGLVLWDRLPELIPIHWGMTGEVDGVAGPIWVVLVLPLLLLALQWFAVWITLRDPKAAQQNPKAMRIALWSVPLVSLFSCGIIYACALEYNFNLFRLVPIFLAAVFLFTGNYMPKITQNSRLGVKIRWTLYSEENWNATHRFCGKVWVLCGIFVLLGAILPEKWIPAILLLAMLALILSCTLYPYLYYRKQVREGLAPIPKKPLTQKRILAILGTVLGILFLVGLFGYLMFTGDIRLRYEQTFFVIEADFISDLTVEYDAVTSVEYRDTMDYGSRIAGFNSLRLLMGTFHNEEFGKYSLYAYTGNHGAVLLRSGDQILVIGGRTPEETVEIYETLKENIQ